MPPSRPESARNAEEKAVRRAQALKDNLRRRKDQAKGRTGPDLNPSPQTVTELDMELDKDIQA